MNATADPYIFFLVGSERSGTTVTRLLLGHHSMIAPCFEMPFLTDLLSGDHEWPSLAMFRRRMATSRSFRANGFRLVHAPDYPSLARSLLLQCRSDQRQTHVGATVHRQFDHLLRIWPHAKFIHLVRDPRDVALSIIKMGWAGNGWYAAKRWIDAESAWGRLESRVHTDQVLELTFEALVQNPEAEMRRVCGFLGLAFEPTMLAIDQDTTYSTPRADLAGCWMRNPDNPHVHLSEKRVGRLLERRGYKPSGPPIGIRWPRRLWLSFQNRVYCLRFRLERYGLPLLVQAALSRRLPFYGWRRTIHMRVSEVTEHYLK